MTRDADIARIADLLHEHAKHHFGGLSRDLAPTLYEAGLRPSVEPAGLRAAIQAELDAMFPEDESDVRAHIDQIEAILAALPTQASDSRLDLTDIPAADMTPEQYRAWMAAGHPAKGPLLPTQASDSVTVEQVEGMPGWWFVVDGKPVRSADPPTQANDSPEKRCGCTADTELAAGAGCTVCGHRDHGRSGCDSLEKTT